MKFETCKTSFAGIDTDVLILGIYKGEEPQKVLQELDSKVDKELSANLESFLAEEGFKGNGYESRSFPTFGTHPARRFLVFGLPVGGSPTETSRKFGANIARKLDLLKKATTLTVILRTGGAGSKSKSTKSKKTRSKAGSDRESQMSHVQALVEGMVMGAFDFDKYKTVSEKSNNGASRSTRKKKTATASKVRIAGLTLNEKDFAEAVRRGQAVGEATNFARCLVAEPPAYMTPTRLAREAESMAKQSGLTARILDETEIKKLGMGSFLGVARGADEPARLIVLKYSAGRSKKTVGLVGKGITFDSGGLSLKPAASMERMKYDMSGAAAVIGAMKAIAALKPKVSVLAVVAATENMPSGKALHPGDVLKSMNGKTIEVNNTDAEGRLILADALTYAQQQGVDEIIDIATLTGAIVAALGRVAAGIMGTDQKLIDRVMQAGEASGERFWQMPLFDDYKQALKSDIADLKNAGSRGEAGSSCAGMFLKEFVDSVPWVHLDIAGVAWSEKNKDEINKGGTAFGVRTLSRFVMDSQP